MRTYLLAAILLAPAGVEAKKTDPEGAGAAKHPGTNPNPLGTPAGDIVVPPDPQAGLPGAVEYQRSGAGIIGGLDDAKGVGGLVAESDLGDPEATDEDGDEPTPPPYRGVTPGARERAQPYDSLVGRKKTYITWIGYEPNVDRVFVQLSRPVDYTITRGPKGELVLDLHGAAIGVSNDTKPLDLTHFQTAVARVYAKRVKGGNTRLVIELREHTPYRLERKGRYIYVYFRG